MPLRDIILATLVVSFWGGNFIAAKLGMAEFPPMFYTLLRFILVAVVLVPFLKKPTRVQLKAFIWMAFTLGFLHFSLLFAGIGTGLSIPAAVIAIQLGVPFSCLLGVYFFGDKLGVWRITGLLLAFAGLMLVAGAPSVEEHFDGFILTVAAAFIWAVSNVITKKLGRVDVFQLLGWMSVFAIPMLAIGSWFFEPVSVAMVREASLAAWLALLYTVIASTFAAYGLWYALLQKHSISQLAPFNLLSPVVGIAGGQLFFSEVIGWQMVVGGVVTLAGVAVIIFRRPRTIKLAKGT